MIQHFYLTADITQQDTESSEFIQVIGVVTPLVMLKLDCLAFVNAILLAVETLEVTPTQWNHTTSIIIGDLHQGDIDLTSCASVISPPSDFYLRHYCRGQRQLLIRQSRPQPCRPWPTHC